MLLAADEKRKNSLQMIHLLMLIVIAACLVCILLSGLNHRRRALEAGESYGSPWHHIQQWVSDNEVRKFPSKGADCHGVNGVLA